MGLKTYRQLKVWQIAISLVESVYALTGEFPTSEQFGLTSQLRRAVVSIPSNIAEGWGRMHQGEYLYHLRIARGSLMEVETQLIVAVRLKYASKQAARPCWDLAQQTGKMLTVMISSLKQTQPIECRAQP